jgi:hypothetical protein
MCPPGADVGTKGCTWYPLGGGQPDKTIEFQCLYHHGLASACKNATPIPGIGCTFDAARDILIKAFSSVDPAQGGCEDVGLRRRVVFRR